MTGDRDSVPHIPPFFSFFSFPPLPYPPPEQVGMLNVPALNTVCSALANATDDDSTKDNTSALAPLVEAVETEFYRLIAKVVCMGLVTV